VGVVTGTDLMRLEHANPIYIVGDLAKAPDVDAVVALSRRLPVVVDQLTTQSTTADDTCRVATAVRDAVERRLLQLAEQALGPPPVPYCWVVLGSQARLEVALAGDQDNALLLDDAATPEDDEYFGQLARLVSDGLAACGYAYCAGEVMATNPRWRQPFSAWRRTLSDWMRRPEPQAVLSTSIFFDMRGLSGAVELARRVQDHVLTEAPDRRAFLTHLAGHAVSTEPPLGFFRQFVLEGAGDHRDTLDLKARGLAPVVEVARVHALAAGAPALNTHARLRAAAAEGRVRPQSAEDLSEAFEFIAAVRLRHQCAAVRDARPVDNHLRPEELSSLERRHLRDAFRVVKQAQGVLAATHGTRLVT
jgi:CBS domain-containing protein